jgi:hypothetical protein
VRGEVVEDHDVAGLERRRKELLHLGTKGGAGHRAVEHEQRDDAALPEPGDEGRGLTGPCGTGATRAPPRDRGHSAAPC